jgi:hypothetical protein
MPGRKVRDGAEGATAPETLRPTDRRQDQNAGKQRPYRAAARRRSKEASAWSASGISQARLHSLGKPGLGDSGGDGGYRQVGGR